MYAVRRERPMPMPAAFHLQVDTIRKASKQKPAEVETARHAGVVHDVSNALMNADWSLQLIGRHAHDAAIRGKMCRVARRELAFARHLLRSLARPESLETSRPVNLNRVAAARLELISGLAQERGVTVEASYVAEPALVQGHKTHYRRVLDNLLINALQATPRRGRIGLRISREKDQVVLVIANTGRGMDERTLARVSNGAVTGQGLKTTASLVIKRGGRLVIDSAVGQGTAVTVSYPAAPARKKVRRLSKRKRSGTLSTSSAAGARTPPAARDQGQAARTRTPRDRSHR